MKPFKLISLIALLFLITNSAFAQMPFIPQNNNPNTTTAKQVAPRLTTETAASGKGKKATKPGKKIIVDSTITKDALPLIGINLTDNPVITKTAEQEYIESLKQMSDDDLTKTLNTLKGQLRSVSVFDTDKIVTLSAHIDTIKNINTQGFLTKLRPPKPYLFTQLAQYNQDTLNKYFYNQGNSVRISKRRNTKLFRSNCLYFC